MVLLGTIFRWRYILQAKQKTNVDLNAVSTSIQTDKKTYTNFILIMNNSLSSYDVKHVSPT